MAKRPSKEQSTHYGKVRELSLALKIDGHIVRADIRGNQSPRPISKSRVRPDIVATRSGTTKIVEVETPNSLTRDKEQSKTFVRSVAHRKGTAFNIVVTKPRETKRR